jgi:hypothetical protein
MESFQLDCHALGLPLARQNVFSLRPEVSRTSAEPISDRRFERSQTMLISMNDLLDVIALPDVETRWAPVKE